MTELVVRTRTVEDTVSALSCPFCGSNNLSISSQDYGGGYSSYYVYCTNCYAHGPTHGHMVPTKQDAVNLWNKRRNYE